MTAGTFLRQSGAGSLMSARNAMASSGNSVKARLELQAAKEERRKALHRSEELQRINEELNAELQAKGAPPSACDRRVLAAEVRRDHDLHHDIYIISRRHFTYDGGHFFLQVYKAEEEAAHAHVILAEARAREGDLRARLIAANDLLAGTPPVSPDKSASHAAAATPSRAEEGGWNSLSAIRAGVNICKKCAFLGGELAP